MWKGTCYILPEFAAHPLCQGYLPSLLPIFDYAWQRDEHCSQMRHLFFFNYPRGLRQNNPLAKLQFRSSGYKLGIFYFLFKNAVSEQLRSFLDWGQTLQTALVRSSAFKVCLYILSKSPAAPKIAISRTNSSFHSYS